MNKSKYDLDTIDPRKITPNRSNPRGESPDEIYSDKEFIRLKDSVFEFGVLVPLIVKEKPKKEDEYILIDGERRWRAAIATNQEKVPAYIARDKKLLKEELRRTFQIHMLRKQWSRLAQARSLKMIIGQIKQEEPNLKRVQLFETIQDRTGYTETALRDLLRVLKFSDKILDEVSSNKSSLRLSHLVQIEASFVEQVSRQYPSLTKEYGKKLLRRKMLDKVRKGSIATTRNLMDDLLPVFLQAKTKEQKDYLKKLLIHFIENTHSTPDEVARKFGLEYPVDVKDLTESVNKIKDDISSMQSVLLHLNFAQLKSFRKLRTELEDILMPFGKFINKIIRKL